MNYDVVIVGGSFAGLTLAHYLPKEYSVLVIDEKNFFGQSVESTGLITQATYDMFASFVDIEKFIPNKITTIGVVDYSYEKFFFSHTEKPWIYSTDTPGLIQHMADTLNRNVQCLVRTRFNKAMVDYAQKRYPVRISCVRDGKVLNMAARFIVGADGSFSRVAQAMQLSMNKQFLAGFEKVFYGDITFGDHPESTVYHFWFGEFSLGYGGWLSPTVINGKKAFRLGLAKLKKHIREWVKINDFVQILTERNIISIEPGGKEILHFSSLIPIGGPLKQVFNDHTLLLGDAAGLCGAFAADGIKGALVSGKVAGRLIPQFLEGDTSILKTYYPEINKYQGLMRYYHRQILYRLVWNLMQSNRTFGAMFSLISTQKESFLDQFCDNKDKNKSLARVILKSKIYLG